MKTNMNIIASIEKKILTKTQYWDRYCGYFINFQLFKHMDIALRPDSIEAFYSIP